MSNPTVSVVMPVYNGEKYLRLAIESVLGQTFRDFEIIVVDDGSTDSTPSIARAFGEQVRYVTQQNSGCGAAVNHGIRTARGRYFAWLSYDDLFAPEKLAEQVRALERVGAPAVSYTDMKWIDTEGNVLAERELPLPARHELVKAILLGEPVSFAGYSLVCDLCCFEQVGYYDETKRHTEDADMLLRLARRFPFVRVPQMLTLAREHDTRVSRRPTFEAEARTFYGEWLDALTPAELSESPDSALARAMSRKEIADVFLRRDTKMWTALARAQYRKALAESPLALPAVLGTLFFHFLRSHRQFYRLGLRSYLQRRLDHRWEGSRSR